MVDTKSQRKPTLVFTKKRSTAVSRLKDLAPATVTGHREFEHLQVFKDQARRSGARNRGHLADAFARQLATALHAELSVHGE